MHEIGSFVTFLGRRNRYDVFEFSRDLWQGEMSAWVVLSVIIGTISFFAIYKSVTGKQFVKSKKERRDARNRRKNVLWEYTWGD